jgi:hypothetical protein
MRGWDRNGLRHSPGGRSGKEMILGIMQPYFFPYLSYFSLIKQCDRWISLDCVQYIERGWVNRNRILHPNRAESTYINVPLKKHHQKTSIKEILIDDAQPYAGRRLVSKAYADTWGLEPKSAFYRRWTW